MTPLAAPQALDAYYLEARCKLLDLAAILDRIGRGRDGGAAVADPRLESVRRALEVLQDSGAKLAPTRIATLLATNEPQMFAAN